MRSLILALAVFIAGITSAQAGCTGKSTQAAKNKCAAQVYRVNDSRMNRVYRVAMKAQSGNQKGALRKAQRSWVAFRDNACKSYSYLGDGGSTRPLLYSACLSKLTRQRTKMLQMQTVRF